MSLVDEAMAEQAALDWFEALGYERVFGLDIAPQAVPGRNVRATSTSFCPTGS